MVFIFEAHLFELEGEIVDREVLDRPGLTISYLRMGAVGIGVSSSSRCIIIKLYRLML